MREVYSAKLVMAVGLVQRLVLLFTPTLQGRKVYFTLPRVSMTNFNNKTFRALAKLVVGNRGEAKILISRKK